jgi:hypothetical protein
MSRKNNYKILGLTTLLLTTSFSFAYADNYPCPAPTEIQSTDFTAPSIWIAPPIVHSKPGQVGVGLGGKKVKRLLGVENIRISGRPGWACVYKTEGGISVFDYETRIRGIVAGNKFLLKYLEKVNKAFENAEPYLKNYPKDQPIGFVGYELDDGSQNNNNNNNNNQNRNTRRK